MVLGTLEDGGEEETDLEIRQRMPPETPLLTTDEAAIGPQAEPEADEQSPPKPAEGSPPPEPPAPAPSMSEAILDEYDYERPKRGDVRKGVVVSVGPEEIVVDIGAKRECLVQSSDLEKLGSEAVAQIHEGDEVSVYIVKPENREGHLIGSLYLAQMEDDWTHAEELERSGEIFEAKVTGQNRGGLLVPFGRLRGFVPASHLVGTGSSTADRSKMLGHWLGRTLPFKVIEVNRRRNRLILSYRAARRQWRSQQKRNLLEELQEGDVRRGIVSSLASFGAFVDLGGADGLIHISEMAWYRVEQPSDVLQVGQEVDVYVLRVDRERGRIGLSLKRLQPDPWTLVEAQYRPDQLVEVKITKLVDFGAFAELEKGIEGLIHITELADPTPVRADEIVLPDEVCLARVLRVDAQNRRIGLSLKAVDPAEFEAWQASRMASEATEPEEAAEPEEESASTSEAAQAPEVSSGTDLEGDSPTPSGAEGGEGGTG